MRKEQLNSEVLKYQESRSESAFRVVYDYFITRNDRKFKTIGKSIGADYYEARAIYEDTLLSCIESYNGECSVAETLFFKGEGKQKQKRNHTKRRP